MTDGERMRTCAVVLNWRDPDRTVRCIAALLESEEIDHVFVVDNETTGKLRPLVASLRNGLSQPWSLMEFAENRGFAGGVNAALSEALTAGFDAILVVNNDAVIDAKSVSRLTTALLARPDLGLVAPRILDGDGHEESAGGYLNPWLGTTSHATRSGRIPDFITWACVLVRADALRSVGLLSEEFFMYWEDVDMSLRLRAGGWKLEVCSEAALMHEVSTNKTSYPVAIKAYHTWSGLVFARKHRGAWLVGAYAWLIISAGMNAIRLRKRALRGLRLGVLLARENTVPAYLSPRRLNEFS